MLEVLPGEVFLGLVLGQETKGWMPVIGDLTVKIQLELAPGTCPWASCRHGRSHAHLSASCGITYI